MKTVFLYAGQGSQKVGMGKDFYEEYEAYRELVDQADLDFSLLEKMHEGPEETLSQTEYTQPCMAAFAAGVTQLLELHGVKPDAVCGLSLGEYSALFAAGVFDAKTLIQITAFRGRKMAEASKNVVCSMSAVLGLTKEKTETICQNCQDTGYVTVANYNCPGQYVLCGEEAAVAQAEAKCKEAGALRCVRLKVSGPFHTKYMKPAGEALSSYLADIPFEKPKIPVALNVTGRVWKPEEDIKQLLVRQVQSSVYLEDDLRTLLSFDDACFVEIGPGRVLSGFLKKTARQMRRSVQVQAIETVADFQKVVETVQERQRKIK